MVVLDQGTKRQTDTCVLREGTLERSPGGQPTVLPLKDTGKIPGRTTYCTAPEGHWKDPREDNLLGVTSFLEDNLLYCPCRTLERSPGGQPTGSDAIPGGQPTGSDVIPWRTTYWE
ncbi:hypothetical protein ACOMHN_032004 [Nucella lapillus]